MPLKNGEKNVYHLGYMFKNPGIFLMPTWVFERKIYN